MNRTLAILTLIAALAGAGCDDFGPESGPPFDSNAPTQTIERTRIIWSEGGKKSAVIQAKELLRYEQRDEVLLRDSVQVDLYDENGALAAIVTGDEGIINERARTARVEKGIKVHFLGSKEYRASTLTARNAHAEERTKRMTATGDVEIVSESGVSLTTGQLVWDGRIRRFRAPGLVRLTNGTEVEEGENLDANADLTQWTMERVRGQSTRPREEVESRVRRETGR